jgi:uncharacterized protein YjbI with pentapeptide repeats
MEAIEHLLQDSLVGHLHLIGPGAETTVARLQTALRSDTRIAFPKFPLDWGDIPKSVRVVITDSLKRQSPHDAEEQHRLMPLDRDDVIALLLEQDPCSCAHVLSLLEAQHYSDLGDDYPIWDLLLKSLATSDTSVGNTLWMLLIRFLDCGDAGSRTCLRRLDELGEWLCQDEQLTSKFDPESIALRLLQLPTNQTRVLSNYIANRLTQSDTTPINRMYSQAILRAIATKIKTNRSAIKTLRKSIASKAAATALSILNQLSVHTPIPGIGKHKLHSAWLDHCKWPGIKLQETEFESCDLYAAKWNSAQVDRCCFYKSCFDQASLESCSLKSNIAFGSTFRGASFSNSSGKANLWRRCDFTDSQWSGAMVYLDRFSHCRFEKATLDKACFSNCQFRGCDFSNANWTGLDARGSSFHDCRLDGLRLSHSTFERSILDGNFEDIELKHVDLQHARLVGSMWTGSKACHVNLSNANLANGKLAEIEWSHCDLRNADLSDAIFHFGSSRCGLVGSPYPSHGTRTGFYTEPSEDLYHLEPELVRRAALLDCDLRGANLHGVNLYLVDLRGSRLDASQRKHAIATGAILEE